MKITLFEAITIQQSVSKAIKALEGKIQREDSRGDTGYPRAYYEKEKTSKVLDPNNREK